MAKTYDAGEFTLKKLLQDYDNLKVPLFQRGYSWGKDEINELFSDAVDIDWQKLKTKGERETHFMGAMVFCNVGGDANAKDGYNILDGQQRLTTLTMIVAAIARRMQVIAAAEKEQKDIISKSAAAAVYLNSIYKVEPTDDSPGVLVLSPQEEDGRMYEVFVSDQKVSLNVGIRSAGFAVHLNSFNQRLMIPLLSQPRRMGSVLLTRFAGLSSACLSP